MLECSKAEVIPYLEAERRGQQLPAEPDRRTKLYFHEPITEVFQKAIVNVTAGTVESLEELPDVQGPVDYDEFDQIERLCNSHPKVLEEVRKLKLPAGYVYSLQLHIIANPSFF